MATENLDIISGGRGGMDGAGAFGSGVVGFILGTLLRGGNGGVLGGGNGGDSGVGGFELGKAIGTMATQNDICTAVSDIQNQATQYAQLTAASLNSGFDRTNANITTTGIQLAGSLNAIGEKVTQASYNTALQFNQLDNKLCGLQYNLSTQATTNTQAILDKLCMMESNDLRSQLNETQRERDLLATGNFPISRQAAVVYPDPCKHSEQINIVNQNVNAIGSSVQQLAGIIAGMQNKKVA